MLDLSCTCLIGLFFSRSVYVVYTVLGDVSVFLVGKDEYDELACEYILYLFCSCDYLFCSCDMKSLVVEKNHHPLPILYGSVTVLLFWPVSDMMNTLP